MASIVFFHAHPDDETLWTGGTIAAMSDAGHTVTVVCATDGWMRELPETGSPRVGELTEACEVLGAANCVNLGYADSGKGPILYPDPSDRQRFVRAEVSEAAEQLARVLDEVDADGLVYYDTAGANHHPDHVRCHLVGEAAARLRPSVFVLEATIPRELLVWSRRCLGWLPWYPYTAAEVTGGGTPRPQIDVRVDVARFIPRKLAALLRHHTVITSSSATAGLAKLLSRCPHRLLRPLIGREWYRGIRGDGAAIFATVTGSRATSR